MKIEKLKSKNNPRLNLLKVLTLLGGVATLTLSTLSQGAIIFSEDFEDGSLDTRISVTSVGISVAAGIKDNPIFSGIDNAFGFGRSTCGSSCFTAHTTLLKIDFGSPVFVDTLSFKEMELFGNWGSEGKIIVDGYYLGTNIPYSPPAWPANAALQDFGRAPVNSGVADTTYRTQSFAINQTVSTLGLYVWDITRVSEIYIDDLTVTGHIQNVPEPGTLALLGLGLASLAASRRRKQ